MALPANGSTHLIPAYYSFYRPRKDERLSWPSWLTYSGWLTHISGHPSAAGQAQDRESSPARDRRSTTVPRHQLFVFVLHLNTLARNSGPPDFAHLTTRGNKYKLQKSASHNYNLRKFSFCSRIVNIWNSLPDSVVNAECRYA